MKLKQLTEFLLAIETHSPRSVHSTEKTKVEKAMTLAVGGSNPPEVLTFADFEKTLRYLNVLESNGPKI